MIGRRVSQIETHWRLQRQTVRAMIRADALGAARVARRYRLPWPDVWAREQGPRPTGATAARYATPLLTKPGLAALTRTSARTVERWVAAGMPTRNVGANVRANRDDARDWLRGRYGIDIGQTPTARA